MRHCIATVFLATLPGMALCQCPGGNCFSSPWQSRPVLAADQVLTTPAARLDVGYRWAPVPSNPAQRALLLDGKQIGNYDLEGGYYRNLNFDGTWGPHQDSPPFPLPADQGPVKKFQTAIQNKPDAEEADAPVKNFGIDFATWPGRETYELNGRVCSKQQAIEAITGRAIGAGELIDDSALPRLVCVGDAELCKKALSNPALANVLSKVQVVGRTDRLGYAADDYWATNRGYKPGYYLIKPDGKLLWSATDWSGDPAPILAALSPGGTPTLPRLPDISPLMIVAALVILLLVVNMNRKAGVT